MLIQCDAASELFQDLERAFSKDLDQDSLTNLKKTQINGFSKDSQLHLFIPPAVLISISALHERSTTTSEGRPLEIYTFNFILSTPKQHGTTKEIEGFINKTQTLLKTLQSIERKYEGTFIHQADSGEEYDTAVNIISEFLIQSRLTFNKRVGREDRFYVPENARLGSDFGFNLHDGTKTFKVVVDRYGAGIIERIS